MQKTHAIARLTVATSFGLLTLIAAVAAGAAVMDAPESVPAAQIDWEQITATANQLHTFN